MKPKLFSLWILAWQRIYYISFAKDVGVLRPRADLVFDTHYIWITIIFTTHNSMIRREKEKEEEVNAHDDISQPTTTHLFLWDECSEYFKFLYIDTFVFDRYCSGESADDGTD